MEMSEITRGALGLGRRLERALEMGLEMVDWTDGETKTLAGGDCVEGGNSGRTSHGAGRVVSLSVPETCPGSLFLRRRLL